MSPVRMTLTGTDPEPSLMLNAASLDGQSVAFVNNPGGRSDIWLQPLSGSAPKPLTKLKAEQILGFDWSPDGHSLAFVSNVETSDVVLIDQRPK